MNIVQEDIDQKTVALTIQTTKLTGRILAKAITAALRKMKHARDAPHQGKQTVKQLARQNAGMQNIEITDGNIKSFERVARKYGVDFALKKASNIPAKWAGRGAKNAPLLAPATWLVFFKARDADALTAAFTEFSKTTLGRTKKPSVLEALRNFKELVKSTLLDRSKVKERGGPEL